MEEKGDWGELPPEFHELNSRQKKFILAYLETKNATQSAKAAGYSEKSAHAQGCYLLKHPEIQKILELMHRRETTFIVENYDITRQRILDELAKVAFGNPRRIAKWRGKSVELLPSEEISEADAACIRSISASSSSSAQGGSESISINFGDKVKALELLGKSQGMFSDADARTDDSAHLSLKERLSELRRKMLGTPS